LFYDNLILNSQDLILPHPEIPNRRFVLAPLCDIAEDLLHPTLKKTVKDLLYELTDDAEVSRLPDLT
jgi:2-amino-4-hydroxy-6-hydroxymethyldihydropteridine diphosphokinase